jgi:hypothetical protein
MVPPRKQKSLLRIYPQPTPSPNDPPGADKFYWALGVAMVAWGRLEGNFIACLMMVIQIAKDKHTKLAMKWDRQAIIWKDAFARIPSLKPYERDATDFLAKYGELSANRNLMIHAIWENFKPGSPLAIDVLNIKAVSGTPNDIGVTRGAIRIDLLELFTANANHLNVELTKLGKDLSALQGLPSSDSNSKSSSPP